MRSGPACLGHRVTHYTLSPLGYPEIAIGHEPRIEPWLTLSRHSLVALANSTVPLAHHRRLIRMGTSHTSPAKPNYRGLDLEKTSRLRSRQNFFLDIPFDRTHWRNERVDCDSSYSKKRNAPDSV